MNHPVPHPDMNNDFMNILDGYNNLMEGFTNQGAGGREGFELGPRRKREFSGGARPWLEHNREREVPRDWIERDRSRLRMEEDRFRERSPRRSLDRNRGRDGIDRPWNDMSIENQKMRELERERDKEIELNRQLQRERDREIEKQRERELELRKEKELRRQKEEGGKELEKLRKDVESLRRERDKYNQQMEREKMERIEIERRVEREKRERLEKEKMERELNLARERNKDRNVFQAKDAYDSNFRSSTEIWKNQNIDRGRVAGFQDRGDDIYANRWKESDQDPRRTETMLGRSVGPWSGQDVGARADRDPWKEKVRSIMSSTDPVPEQRRSGMDAWDHNRRENPHPQASIGRDLDLRASDTSRGRPEAETYYRSSQQIPQMSVAYGTLRKPPSSLPPPVSGFGIPPPLAAQPRASAASFFDELQAREPRMSLLGSAHGLSENISYPSRSSYSGT